MREDVRAMYRWKNKLFTKRKVAMHGANGASLACPMANLARRATCAKTFAPCTDGKINCLQREKRKYRKIMQSLQNQYAPEGRCFGCGPKNDKGLQIQSYVQGQEVVADFTPAPHHEAFENVLNGGIIGTVLDCHCNWAAAHYLMQSHAQETAPCTVTAQYTIKLLRPTPTHQKLHLVARLDKLENDRAWISGELKMGDMVYATCHGLFVSVKPSHPAYHRW